MADETVKKPKRKPSNVFTPTPQGEPLWQGGPQWYSWKSWNPRHNFGLALPDGLVFATVEPQSRFPVSVSYHDDDTSRGREAQYMTLEQAMEAVEERARSEFQPVLTAMKQFATEAAAKGAETQP